jgi:hypothetical protein
MRAAGDGAPLVVAAMIAGAMVRLALAATMPIGDDEAYYWLWSQRLAWGYPDHPPMIAAVIAASIRLLGDEVFGIRALTVLMATITPLLIYAVGRAMFDHRAALRATLISVILPAFAIGTVFAFPDVPLALFWALALWTGWRALQAGGWWWVAAGVAVGLALLSKLTAFGLLVGFAGVLVTGDWRRAARDPGFYAGALVAALLFAPVVAWNVTHEWFLVDITVGREPWTTPRSAPVNLLFFLGGQILYYGTLAPALVAAIVAAARRREPRWRYLFWMSAPVLAATIVAALGARPKPHWPAPAYLAAALALGALWEEWVRGRPRVLRFLTASTAALTIIATLIALLPWGRDQVAVGIGRWDRVAAAIEREIGDGRDRVLVLTDTYQAASHLAYRLRTRVPVTTTYGAFAVWWKPEWTGWSALYVDEPLLERNLPIETMCRNIRPVDRVEFSPGRVVGLYRCDDVRWLGPDRSRTP